MVNISSPEEQPKELGAVKTRFHLGFEMPEDSRALFLTYNMDFSTITGHFPYLGLFTLLILGGIGFPIPEAGTLILCGLLISRKVIEPVYGLVIVYSGVLIGDYVFYSIGRKYGRMIIKLKIFSKG